VQYDGAASHTPPLQNLEQQSPFAVHALPDVLHAGLSGVHVPLPHSPPQHSPLELHDVPSDLHWLPEHWKFTHANEQQSGPTEQFLPAARHCPATWTHSPTVGSQLPVQHSLSVVQAVPVSVHDGAVFLLLPHAARSTKTAHRIAFFIEKILLLMEAEFERPVTTIDRLHLALGTTSRVRNVHS
jgi:hypothetical protein